MSTSSPTASLSVRASSRFLRSPSRPSVGPSLKNHLVAVYPWLAIHFARSAASLRVYGESQRAGVCGKLGAGRASKQGIDRLIQRLTLEVPESAVHDANSHHRLALATVDHRAVHHVPESLDGQRVLADEQRPERGVYDERLAAGAGAGQSDHAVVGVNLQERGANGVTSVAQAGRVVRALIPVLRVDVLRPDEPLLPEGVGMLHHAVQFAQLEVGYLHWGCLREIWFRQV